MGVCKIEGEKGRWVDTNVSSVDRVVYVLVLS